MSQLSRWTRFGVERLEDRAVPATLLVDDDRRQFRNAEFTSIQAAVDAADAGDTILVARGTYTEQVTIPDDKDDLTLRSQQSQRAVIEAPATLTGELAIVTVDGADGVTIRGFTVTGPAGTADGLTYGVAVVNGGSATIEDNFITKIRNNPLNGSQTGIGIIVNGGDAATSAVIRDNTITDYQKGGVVIFGEEAEATVADNTIVGAGPTDLIAQNGVQVSDGADALVIGNTIRANAYTGPDVSGSGVLVDTAGSVVVADNRLSANEDGLLVLDTDDIVVVGNRIFDSTNDGIDLIRVNGGLVYDNRVENNDTDGVVLSETTGVVVVGNNIRRNGQDGLVFTDGSADNIAFGNTLRGNARFDAFDDTTGDGTAGTANFWFFNRIGTKNNPDLR
jgi:parallel beta-helix repeat protein